MMKATLLILLAIPALHAGEPAKPAIALGGPGWTTLDGDDFVNVNCHEDTWTWKDGVAHCTGKPVGVIRTKDQFTNFEMTAEWSHRKPAGNSGIFVWTIPASIKELESNAGKRLPQGIEVQVLDLEFKTNYEKRGKVADWFTCHGDVFPVGAARMQPFPPAAPNGRRSFPTHETTRGAGEWNHYYIRAINGEVRLWVNGAEVSGGTKCEPATGYICLESEGSPIIFRNLRLRVLP